MGVGLGSAAQPSYLQHALDRLSSLDALHPIPCAAHAAASCDSPSCTKVVDAAFSGENEMMTWCTRHRRDVTWLVFGLLLLLLSIGASADISDTIVRVKPVVVVVGTFKPTNSSSSFS